LPPEGVVGEGFFATKLNDVVIGSCKFIVVFAFATSCCGIEFMATMASHYDLARWFRTCFFTSSSGYVDGNGYDFKENGAYITSGL
jgi:NADH:ubiquinone oxidoreductase subunit B-like Fe-S oxidoreductase